MTTEALRSVLLCLILIFPAVGAVNAIYHGRLLQDYVRKTRRIEDMAGLARFQRIVARQMYAALAQIGLILAPIIIYSVGLPVEILRLGDIVFVIVPGAIVIALGYYFKNAETEACRIPAVGEDLDKQRLAVIKVWRTRPLPTW